MDEQSQTNSLWIKCPICGGKTRTKVYEKKVLLNFPLYCPKCKKEYLIDLVKLRLVLSNRAWRLKLLFDFLRIFVTQR